MEPSPNPIARVLRTSTLVIASRHNDGHVLTQDFRKLEERAKRVKQETKMTAARRPLIADNFRR
jgi:hypothetical protein